GVFKTLRYDNLKSAVKKILRGHQREETTRFIAFRSHWGFESEFCTPGEGHEKGGVEGEGGYFRRNHMVPVPQVANWEALNLHLREESRRDEERWIDRKQKVRNWEHYLEALTKKPGALAGSTPLEQWRAQGRWPASFDRFWEALKQRRGQQDGTRAMIEALLLGRQYGYPALKEALEKALDLSCFDVEALRLLLTAERS